MTKTTDLSLLFEWFDKKLPVVDYTMTGDSIHFKLFDCRVNITGSYLEDLQLLEWILDRELDSSSGIKGYLIELTIDNQLEDNNIEFFVFTECLDQINKLLLNKDWNYLILRDLSIHKTKVHEAVAQRLTKLQSGVERLSCRNPCFMIARF